MVTPGFIIADQNRQVPLNGDGSSTERESKILAHNPFKRFGETSEMVPTCVTVVSDRASSMNGEELGIDGDSSSMTL